MELWFSISIRYVLLFIGLDIAIHSGKAEAPESILSDPPGKEAEEMNPRKEAIDLYERLRKLGNLAALTLIVIAQFLVQGGVLFFTIWISAIVGGRNLVESWS